MDRNPIINENLKELYKLCEKYKVSTLHVFGSVTSDKFTNKSDIDVLVEFENVLAIDYADYFFDLMHSLEKLFHRKIDLLTEKSLTNPYLIKSINKDKQLIYDRRNKKISA